jgi:hypothetical protein
MRLRPTKSIAHFLSYDVKAGAHRVRVERLIFGGDAARPEVDAESPGSGGASPYQHLHHRPKGGCALPRGTADSLIVLVLVLVH